MFDNYFADANIERYCANEQNICKKNLCSMEAKNLEVTYRAQWECQPEILIEAILADHRLS